MRWMTKPEPNYGEIKIVKRFLFIPRSFKTGDWRWLEIAYVKKQYECKVGLFFLWESINWATKEEYEKYLSTKNI